MTKPVDKAEILTRCTTILVNHFNLEADRIKPSSTFFDDLDLDSLDQVEFVMACEEAFGVMTHDDEAEKFITVQDAVDCIARLQA